MTTLPISNVTQPQQLTPVQAQMMANLLEQGSPYNTGAPTGNTMSNAAAGGGGVIGGLNQQYLQSQGYGPGNPAPSYDSINGVALAHAGMQGVNNAWQWLNGNSPSQMVQGDVADDPDGTGGGIG